MGGFKLVERGIVSMKGKGERLTYWLIGEDPIQRAERTNDRLERRNGVGGKKAVQDLLVPKSSLKNKSLTRTTFLRCSSESPKRLRFSSSDQLNKKCPVISNELECIVDSSPCKGKGLCSIRSNCMESSRSSSNSCPCVEQLCESDDNHKNNMINNICNDEQYFRRALYFGNNKILLDGNCRSAPSSPRHGSMILSSQKRIAQSSEEVDGCDATPLIRSATCVEWHSFVVCLNFRKKSPEFFV